MTTEVDLFDTLESLLNAVGTRSIKENELLIERRDIRLSIIPERYGLTAKHYRCVKYIRSEYDRLYARLERDRDACRTTIREFAGLKNKVIDLLAREATQLLVPISKRQDCVELFRYIETYKKQLSPDAVDDLYQRYIRQLKKILTDRKSTTVHQLNEDLYDLMMSFHVSFRHGGT